MDETSTVPSGHPTVAAAFGLAFALLGAALLLQEMGLLALRWSVVVPLVMLAVGVLLLFSGLVGAHRTADPIPPPEHR